MRIDTSKLNLRQYYQQPQIKSSINLVLSLVLVIILVIFAIKPTLVTIASLKKQLEDEKKVLNLLQQKSNALVTAEKNYQDTRPYFERLDKALPKQPEVLNFNLQLMYLAQKHNIPLSNLSISDFYLIDKGPSKNKESNKKVLQFTLSFVAPWPESKNYMKDLENTERLINILNASHSSKSDGTNISTSIQGEVYFYPEIN